MSKLIRLHNGDNVVIVREKIRPGDVEVLDGREVIFATEIEFGHKVAAREIGRGEKLIKYNMPIGSATEDIVIGAHVHLHNMKSDYIVTYTNNYKTDYEQF